MRSKLLTFGLVITLFLGVFLGVLTDTCDAENGYYKISIEDISSEFIKTTKKGGVTYVYFNIIVTLYNSGDIESDNITVELQDEFGNYINKGTIKAGETKMFIFGEHPLEGLGKHTLDVSYYPTDINIERTKDNTGSETFTVKHGNNNNDNSTPGFEFIFLISTVVFVFLIRKRKKI